MLTQKRLDKVILVLIEKKYMAGRFEASGHLIGKGCLSGCLIDNESLTPVKGRLV